MNDFQKNFTAGFIGYIIGTFLDNTRFGHWFNTNPTVTKCWNAGKAILYTVFASLFVYFIYCVAIQFYRY